MFLKKKEKPVKEKKKEVIKKTLEIQEIRRYAENLGAFQLEDKTFLDIFEVVPKDRSNLQEDELTYDVYNLARFLRLYAPDCKFVSMNFPINTALQKKNLAYAIENTLDPVRKLWLEREMRELELLESTINRREFYLIFYGINSDDFIKNKTNISKWVGQGRNKLVKDITKEKKIQIVKKLNNMNSLITTDFLDDSERVNNDF